MEAAPDSLMSDGAGSRTSGFVLNNTESDFAGQELWPENGW